jgi:predicted kinase
MDLEVSGNRDLAYRFLNRYQQLLGDYAGLSLLHYYQIYRALVRAKVFRLALAQHPDAAGRSTFLGDVRRYLAFAFEIFEQTADTVRTAHAAGTDSLLHQTQQPMLVIMHGLSGSGKSHVAELLAERLPAIRVRSDVERKRLECAVGGENRGSEIGQGRYSPEMTQGTYHRLAGLAGTLLDAEFSVIVDAAFLLHWQRDMLHTVARNRGAAFRIIDLEAPLSLLRERIRQRDSAGTDPSEATIAVLDHQIATREPLNAGERALSIPVDGRCPDIGLLATRIHLRAPNPTQP